MVKFLCRIGIHSWSKWEEYTATMNYTWLGNRVGNSFTGYVQVRTCEHCGLKERLLSEQSP